jgi:hypothetical protein
VFSAPRFVIRKIGDFRLEIQVMGLRRPTAGCADCSSAIDMVTSRSRWLAEIVGISAFDYAAVNPT